MRDAHELVIDSRQIDVRVTVPCPGCGRKVIVYGAGTTAECACGCQMELRDGADETINAVVGAWLQVVRR